MDKLEEVKNLRQLLDEGIIDEDDFKKKKAQILGLAGNNTKEEIKEETEDPKANKTKSKSLDDYEKELMGEGETTKPISEEQKDLSFKDVIDKETTSESLISEKVMDENTKEFEKTKELVNLKEKMTDIDNSFYTSSMKFNKDDFEGFEELEKSVKKGSFFKVILIM